MTSTTNIDYQSESVRIINENIGTGDQVRLKIISGSMTPMLHIEDHITIQHGLPDDYRVGDIIVFTQGKEQITHRIVDRGYSVWLTKGDQLSQADPPVRYDQILGKVICIQRTHDVINLQDAKWVRAQSWIGSIQKSHYSFAKRVSNHKYLSILSFKLSKIICNSIIYQTRMI